jgi:uncharacterized membrane-anchored protein
VILITILVVLVIFAYLACGIAFLGTFAWCLGMPASSCRTRKQKAIKSIAELSMVLFFPLWIIFMIIILIVGK